MKTRKMTTLIGIQQEYIKTLNAGIARWSHYGHFGRIARAARHAAERRLRKIGFTNEKQIAQIIQDARDMALAERNGERQATLERNSE